MAESINSREVAEAAAEELRRQGYSLTVADVDDIERQVAADLHRAMHEARAAQLAKESLDRPIASILGRVRSLAASAVKAS